MDEWRGPWKCEKCGERQDETPHWRGTIGHQHEKCNGGLIPHDRRAPDPRVDALVKAA